ncbi:hypothetical protein COCCADRAFT_10482 [Bipolaris zeicola 26-R-13]|uniref:Glycoside hydrolase family 127 protein n=1 Tax=Cochliobolus carbonum (strain 26-R-13) TaxID=930089 RepID=W6Y635_COCC2|nr:uncharacterized protein COCCADRAFT_10482 [Bipolaris zeicola 26-R-13]EUC26721.1 hypothetical protein COCCADRAFT_10482 [Bipolaris zeicola 26-R-13]
MLLKASFAGYLLVVVPIFAQTIPTVVVPEVGTSAHAFDLSQVALSNSRWKDNENRTLNYLKFVNVDRLLYNFRATHKLSTNGAQPNGGWDAPTFPFRSHVQGHYLTGWVHCYATLRDSTCKDRAAYFVQELAKCQANNGVAGFSPGYLSGFPESEFAALEAGKLTGGNVPYYAVHKTMAGLLDAWRIIGDQKARDVLLALTGWVDGRTKKLSTAQMQTMLGTEFGGMNDVLAEIYQLTGDKQWLTVAQRFDHAKVFDPLANNQDQLNGNHANTQVPKWIGAAREYKSTGTKRYLDIAKNAWDFTINAHTYAIGGNSQAEHFRPPNQISNFLTNDTAEQCNTYNMLKLTRDLWTTDPTSTKYFDYYERALINHLLGAQNPGDNHGHITYFTPLKSGGRRGVGPAWGGGTWSTDYNSFWCCQGTALETNTKLMDSIYFYDNSALYVNLFTPSTLDWKQRNVKITQVTTFPIGDTTTLTVVGTGNWAMKIRIPSWTSGATISLNGQASGVTANPGSYATLSRTWASGDTVTVKLPMKLRTVPANDNANVAAIAYGPTVLSGNYGQQSLSSMPSLALDSVRRTNSNSLAFTGTANGKAVDIGPFYDAHNINYNVYWTVTGQFST